MKGFYFGYNQAERCWNRTILSFLLRLMEEYCYLSKDKAIFVIRIGLSSMLLLDKPNEYCKGTSFISDWEILQRINRNWLCKPFILYKLLKVWVEGWRRGWVALFWLFTANRRGCFVRFRCLHEWFNLEKDISSDIQCYYLSSSLVVNLFVSLHKRMHCLQRVSSRSPGIVPVKLMFHFAGFALLFLIFQAELQLLDPFFESKTSLKFSV